jgi:hypothetical protein
MTFWEEKQAALKERIKAGNLSDFLRWSEIGITMHVGNFPFVDYEYEKLMTAPDAERWYNAIAESPIGQPHPYQNDHRTSGNLVHQAYHLLRWETVTGQKVQDLQSIYEIGAGYGSMCRLIHRLGFKGDYYIADLPELRLIQQYYLYSNDIHGVGWRMPMEKVGLLLSTWALSEIPIEQRNSLLPAYGSKSALIGYQASFENSNNVEYFNEMPRKGYWQNNYGERLSHMDGEHYYLFGWSGK